MKKIIFHSNREYSLHSNDDHPEPTSKFIPEWYSKSDKYIIDPRTNDDALNIDGTKMLSYKACPALLDIYTTGYMIKTPCDLFFYEENNENNSDPSIYGSPVENQFLQHALLETYFKQGKGNYPVNILIIFKTLLESVILKSE